MAAKKNKQLTDEIIARTTNGSVWRTIFGTLLCVVLFNFAAGWYLASYSPNIGYLLIMAKWDIMRSLPVPVDMLILGDSSGNQGADPEIIRQKLRMSSVNLCTIGDAMVVNDALMLEDYISRYDAPKSVLIIHGYDIWSRDLNLSVLSKIPGSWWDDSPGPDLGLKGKTKIYLNRYLPLYSETRSMAQVIQNPMTAFQNDLNLNPDGFMVEDDARPENVIRDAGVHLEFVCQNHDVVSKPNRKALEFICGLAEQHQFDVFIANGPLYEGLYADSAFQDYFNRVQQTINEIASANDRVHYILNPPATFPAESMQSADHTASEAARIYTERIAGQISLILRENSQ